MKRYSLLIPILAFALSCAKDNENTPSFFVPTCLVTEIKDSATGQIKNTYAYDASHRLTNFGFYRAGSLISYNKYTYNGYTVKWQGYDSASNAFGGEIRGKLNSDGNLESYWYTDDQSLSGKILADTTVVTYGAGKKMLSIKDAITTRNIGSTAILSVTTIKIQYIYTEGLLTKEVITTEDGVSTRGVANVDYFYDESTPTVKYNPVFLLYQADNLQMGYFMSDKIPVKSVLIAIGGNEPDTVITNYSAEVNPQGFPTKIRRFQNTAFGPSNVSTKLYSYTCP